MRTPPRTSAGRAAPTTAPQLRRGLSYRARTPTNRGSKHLSPVKEHGSPSNKENTSPWFAFYQMKAENAKLKAEIAQLKSEKATHNALNAALAEVAKLEADIASSRRS